MVYQSAFYRMLGIPETVVDPTAYHLLGIDDPAVVPPNMVGTYLTSRKHQLRQNIPGPQFIPLISMVEKELDRAAAILSDPKRRAQYDRIVGKAQRQNDQKRAYREKVLKYREVIRSYMRPDGTIDDERRRELSARLRDLGLPPAQIQTVLKEIPGSTAGDPAAAAAFLRTEIEMEIDGGLLSRKSEERLLAMASRLGMPKSVAVGEIEAQLKALGARRGENSIQEPLEDFVRLVKAMHPECKITGRDRRRLVALGHVRGLDGAAVDGVLNNLFETEPVRAPVPPTDAVPAGPPPMPPTPGSTSTRASASAPLLGARQSGAVLHRVIIYGICLVFMGMAIWVWYARLKLTRVDPQDEIVRHTLPLWPGDEPLPSDHPPRRPEPPGDEPRMDDQSPELPGVDPPAMADSLLMAAENPAALSKAMHDAAPQQLQAALTGLAKMLDDGGPPRRKFLTMQIFDSVFRGPPPKAEVQHAAVAAVLEAERSAAPRPAGSSPLAGMLAEALFLDRYASNKGGNFVKQCEQSWDASRRNHPSDPLHDPQRLAYCVMQHRTSQTLSKYASKADGPRFAAVVSHLATLAAKSDSTSSSAALGVLRMCASSYRSPSTSFSAEQRNVIYMALSEVVRQTDSAAQARQALDILTRAFGARYNSPLRKASISTPDERRQLADTLDAIVRQGPEAFANLLAPSSTTSARRTVDRLPTNVSPKTEVLDIRAAYSRGGSTEELLGDLALTALARYDRICRFAARDNHAGGLLAAVVANSSTSDRLDAMAGLVTVDAFGAGPLPNTPRSKPLDAEQLAALGKAIFSTSRGAAYAAIHQLHEANTDESSAVLLEALERMARYKFTRRTPWPHRARTNRILAALQGRLDPKLPAKLIGVLKKARSPYVAHRIVQTLQTSGAVHFGSSRGNLPPNASQEDMESSIRYWTSVENSVTRNRSRLTSPTPPGFKGVPSSSTQAVPPIWAPDATALRLIAAMACFDNASAELLKAYKWGARVQPGAVAPLRLPRPGQSQAIAVFAHATLVADVQASRRANSTQLSRLIREHDGGKALGIKLDMGILQSDALKALTPGPLQEVAVDLHAEGQLLELIVDVTDAKKSVAKAVAEARTQRDKDVAGGASVLHEMREYAYYNLVLWDILLGLNP